MGLWPTDDPEMENRDPNALHDKFAADFHEMFGEPEGIRSLDCVWRNSYKCFEMWKNLCYLILSTLCGLFIATCWGCEFACTAFVHVWQIAPCYKAMEIWLNCFKKFYALVIHTFMDPCCEAFSLCFSAFKK